MAIEAIGTFFRVYEVDGNGNPVWKYRFHNTLQQSVVKGSHTYSYLSFAYQGSTISRAGDNVQSSLILANNAIANAFGLECVQKNYHIIVDTTAVHPQTLAVTNALVSDTWLCSSMTYTPEAIEIVLTSGIDAVGARIPARVLSRELVGHIPVSAFIQAR